MPSFLYSSIGDASCFVRNDTASNVEGAMESVENMADRILDMSVLLTEDESNCPNSVEDLFAVLMMDTVRFGRSMRNVALYCEAAHSTDNQLLSPASRASSF